ncbi:hypothetical protein PLESTB_000589800 [Pleodorina starrii]|uniref:Uncharacterized protein n=1 Tax=Pleodorina starrii TaxID=330485 RepID=A0A9W6BIF5_9CHLO|nr:hypothetical protein PLESTM_000763000 [Pleodorina starrii]GLC52162.1 hypothetical protein PLESTB_000589800 [Pleodorina starrii]GLC75789.1 hypothetical protein PLESTF_001687600 [Pleodorina starrii]
MPTIYCIGGVSGSGKSELRRNHCLLSRLQCFDIADIYDDYPGIGREAARFRLMEQLEYFLQEEPDESVVLEAFFAPGKLQRRGVEDLANEYDARVRYIWCAAPRDVCWNRVLDDSHFDSDERTQARLDFIREARDKYFYSREGEEPPVLLDWSCRDCGDWPCEAPECSECGRAVDAAQCVDCAERRRQEYTCSRACRRRSRRQDDYGYY